MTEDRRRSALVLGGTGLIGSHLLVELADDPRWSSVTALSRRPLPPRMAGAGIREVVADLSRMEDLEGEFAVDRVFVSLGTTMRAAGSKEAFRAVDFHLVRRVAKLAQAAGAGGILLVSSQGADPSSKVFYLRTKGEAEEAVFAAGLPSSTAFRPALLLGDRNEARTLERVSGGILGVLSPLMTGPLKRYRPISGQAVASAMAAVGLWDSGAPRILESEAIAALVAGLPSLPHSGR